MGPKGIRSKSCKILILGNCRQTITVIRSLARSGYDIIVGRSGGKEFTEFSRYVSETWMHPEITGNEEEFINCLIRFITERNDIHAIFPVGEIELACLERYIEQLSPLAKVVAPKKNIFFTCLNKSAMCEIVASIGIPLPETRIARSINELIDNATILGYPCVVKPNDALKPFWQKKAIICNTPQELETSFHAWPSRNEILIVQKYVAGLRHNCNFFAVDGKIRLYFEHRVLRTDRKNGTGYGVDNVTVQPSVLLQEYCSTIIRKLGYSGVGCMQFLISDNGDVHFLEINPRLDANCALPYWYGYDFPKLAVEYAMGLNPAQNVAAGHPVGKRAHWLMGDIRGLLYEVEVGNVNTVSFLVWLINMFKTLMSTNLHITWSWRDPLPSLFLYYRLFPAIVRRIKKMFHHVNREIKVYQLAIQDVRTPRFAKFLLALGLAYTISPLDIIPDFIPVVGHLDDVIIASSLVIIALKMIPSEVIEDNRLKAAAYIIF